MRRVLFTSALVAIFGGVVACGGSGAAKKDPKSGGDVTYEDQPGADPAADPVEPTKPDDPKPEEPLAGDPTEPTKPEEPKKPKEPPKPPGEDLTEAEKTERVSRHQKAAMEATRKEDAEGMIREALDILNIDQTNVEAMVILAHGYFLKGWDDKAEGVLEEAKKRRPDTADKNPRRWMLLALIYDRSKRANNEDLALMAYSKALELAPKYQRAYTNRGVIYLRRKAFLVDGPNGKFGAVLDFEAVDELELDKQLDADARKSCECKTAATCAHLGAAYRGQSSDKGAARDELLVQAERCFKNSMSANANYAPAYFGLGVLYLDADPFPGKEKLKRLQDAITYLKQYEAKARPLKPDAQKVYDAYVSSAQKAAEFEQKMLEKKRQREEEKRKKDAEKKKKEAEGGAKPEGG